MYLTGEAAAASAGDRAPIPPQSLSVAIVTKDEEQNIAATLASVAWASEVIVVDAGSSDRTRSIAEGLGATVIVQEWLGFARQKNFAISLCTSAWILSLDADEIVSAELGASIRAAVAEGPAGVCYSMNRRNSFLGRWMRHGGFYPDAKLRLFPRGAARFEDRAVHETMQCALPSRRLHGDLLHRAYPELSLYLEHMNRYSSLGAQEALKQGKRAYILRDVIVRPALTFVQKYFFRLGFLDGAEGLLLCLFHAYYVSWKYAKMWDARRLSGAPPAGVYADTETGTAGSAGAFESSDRAARHR